MNKVIMGMFWVLVAIVALYFFSTIALGPITDATWDMLGDSGTEAEYTVIGIDKQRVLEGKVYTDKYALTVEYTTPTGKETYSTPLLFGENEIGDTGVLRYYDDTIMLDREVEAHKTDAIGVLLALCLLGALVFWASRGN